MGKKLFIAEKPSVAKEFARALNQNMKSRDGYLESEESVVTWCVGHLVNMSYPEVYDEKYKRWSLDTIPFIPDTFLYQVIDSVKKQYTIVSGLLNRKDVDTIYVCTDSGREGEYIYRLVEEMAGVDPTRDRRRVWIDSQTEEEILRGIREARPLAEYDALSESAYLRAKEDYLMGINFSRVLTLKYGYTIREFLKRDRAVVSVGRVMTCVLGMVVKREREIRSFEKTPFYRVMGSFLLGEKGLSAEWKAVEGSAYMGSPLLYKENGFQKRESAEELIRTLDQCGKPPVVAGTEKKKETKNPPLLYNLAELQNECSKLFKISPDETLRIVQELYEKKMVTYPRTDARVLSTAVSKEIYKNLKGLCNYGPVSEYAGHILETGVYKKIASTRYVNDKQITDHYAIIPTGQGLGNLSGLHHLSAKVYEVIARRFLGIFYPAAIYEKLSLDIVVDREHFFANFKVLKQEGFLAVTGYSFSKKDEDRDAKGKDMAKESDKEGDKDGDKEGEEEESVADDILLTAIQKLKKGDVLGDASYEIKEGETSPPKRYTSGSIILTMENAGQFIEDDELRAQIKGSGIGTSATRAEILKKLVHIEYLSLNNKTQVLTPTLMGEMIYDVVDSSIRPLLDPALTASWEKGLTMVAAGEISSREYMGKLDDFVRRRTNLVKQTNNQRGLIHLFEQASRNYKPVKAAQPKAQKKSK